MKNSAKFIENVHTVHLNEVIRVNKEIEQVNSILHLLTNPKVCYVLRPYERGTGTGLFIRNSSTGELKEIYKFENITLVNTDRHLNFLELSDFECVHIEVITKIFNTLKAFNPKMFLQI